MKIELILEKMRNSSAVIMKANVKCYYCETLIKDGLYLHRDDTLKDIKTNYDFEQVHYTFCPTCRQEVRVAPSDCRNLVRTSKTLNDFEKTYPLSIKNEYYIWSNSNKSILVDPLKVEDGQCYTVGYHDFEHYYFGTKNESNYFNESVSVVIEWLVEKSYTSALNTRRIGKIIHSDLPQFQNKFVETRFNPIYKAYIELDLLNSFDSKITK